ncbi:TetR/AcrR family transcriptional regulator [Bradyrhizobium vignae]|uniref:Putative Transcriptional regulator, TetR family n=1 Tax=Bradyrhizobium vignae TaxID=1549949 RepID=A0A2U3Q6I5_9BRAD|nr:TetR/AcrR family transcriptional regulator [Bradyrhizobium vignae]RXG96597.1 TetR/AcrR family transcriptional regulator [Bradyrhizobium vignae]SPP96958.1 putative Transcriptional regulator, TetR family [Bradyrhizobium vignae]
MARKARPSLRDVEQEAEKFSTPKTEKEKAIIDAAVELFGKQGIDGATTAQIAKQANVTEKTLFRYFPTKKDLVRRVFFPLLLRIGLVQNWESFKALLREKGRDAGFRGWYVALATDRLATVSRNPQLARTVLLELVQNEELRDVMERVWRQYIWQPMLESLTELKGEGAIRKDVDVEVLARAVHCFHIGYFLTRFVFAPHVKWDDAEQIEMMADLLESGAGTRRNVVQR